MDQQTEDFLKKLGGIHGSVCIRLDGNLPKLQLTLDFKNIPAFCAEYERSRPKEQQHTDDAAVDAFALALKNKLAKARAKGRIGWEILSIAELNRQLEDHLIKGDPIDVAAYCMMLHNRHESVRYSIGSDFDLRLAEARTKGYEAGFVAGKTDSPWPNAATVEQAACSDEVRRLREGTWPWSKAMASKMAELMSKGPK